VDPQDENTGDPLNLREFRNVPDDQRAPSPVTPEQRSRLQTPETQEQLRGMTEGPHLLTTEMLQTLLTARDRPPQTSYPKLWDPKHFEGEKAKFKTFLAQCELKFRTEGNRFDDYEKKNRIRILPTQGGVKELDGNLPEPGGRNQPNMGRT